MEIGKNDGTINKHPAADISDKLVRAFNRPETEPGILECEPNHSTTEVKYNTVCTYVFLSFLSLFLFYSNKKEWFFVLFLLSFFYV